jgi:hypothetical protein
LRTLSFQTPTLKGAALTQIEAFALTLLIEAAVSACLAWRLALSPLTCALAALAASSFTHPTLWAVFADASTILGAWTTPLLEAVIMAAETPFYRAIAAARWRDAALLSILVNAASWGAGELIYALT